MRYWFSLLCCPLCSLQARAGPAPGGVDALSGWTVHVAGEVGTGLCLGAHLRLTAKTSTSFQVVVRISSGHGHRAPKAILGTEN